jgi:hypothetical protein
MTTFIVEIGAMKKQFWFIMTVGVVFLTSCGTFHELTYDGHKTYCEVDSANFGVTKRYPASFTIYPFRNTSWYGEAADRAREAVFQSFSLIGPCTRLEDTDKRASHPYNGSDALRVAREENTDAVVLGEAMTQDHFWLILASYAYVRVRLAIYDTKTGHLIWKGDTWSISSDYGITIMAPISSLIDHIYWSRQTMDLYHRVSMDFVHDLRPDVQSTR